MFGTVDLTVFLACKSAERSELVLPETGVCGGSGLFDAADSAGSCCAPTKTVLQLGLRPVAQ